ncbi:hypothetical protein PSHT_14701, partial [Puccinia striiformis]
MCDCTAQPVNLGSGGLDFDSSTAQLDRFIRFNPNIIIIIDEELNIRTASARAIELIGPINKRNLSTICLIHPHLRSDHDDSKDDDDDQQSTYFELKRISAQAKRHLLQLKNPQMSSSSATAKTQNLNVRLSPTAGTQQNRAPTGLLEIYGFEPWQSDKADQQQQVWFSCTFGPVDGSIDGPSPRERFVDRMKHVIFDSVVDWPIHAVSIDRTVSMANQAACKSFQELLPIQDHLAPNDSPSTTGTDGCLFTLDKWRLFDTQFRDELQPKNFPIERALRGETLRNQQYGCIMPDGSRRILTLSAKPIREFPMENYPDGSLEDIVGGLCFVMDVTDDVERTKAIEREREILRAEALAAEDANKSKSAFLSNMSHEIRMPIAVIQGLIELLLDSDLTAQQRDHAETIKASADGLLTVVGDVLDLSKIESGKVTFEHEPFDLAQLVSETERFFAYMARSQSNQFKCHMSIPPLLNTQTIVVGDPCRIRQILNNLLSNALKFTTNGSVLCNFKLEPYVKKTKQETCSEPQLRLTVEVVDTGIGLTAQSLHTLSQFEPFSQADASTSKVYGGTGLGLCIVKSFVDGMGGDILLESNGLGKGCKVTVSVILDRVPPSPPTSPLKSNQSSANPLLQPSSTQNLVRPSIHSLLSSATPHPIRGETRAEVIPEKKIDISKYSILIAEDNPIIGQINMAHLKKAGFVIVDLVNNGQLALNAILKKFYHQHYQLIQSPSKEEVNRIDRTYPPIKTRNLDDDQQQQSRKTYDLVLMDLKMPLLDGSVSKPSKRFAKAIPNVYLPVIALSASASRIDKERCKEAQFDDFLSKPIKADELTKRVMHFLSIVEDVRSRNSSNVMEEKDKMTMDGQDHTIPNSPILAPRRQKSISKLKCESPSQIVETESMDYRPENQSARKSEADRIRQGQSSNFVTTPIAIQVDEEILTACTESTITQFT